LTTGFGYTTCSLFIYAYGAQGGGAPSSQIEGTQSSLSDLLLFENDEAPGVPLIDVSGGFELRGGTEPMASSGCAADFPSPSAHREIHGVLLSKGREATTARRVQTEPETGSAVPALDRDLRSPPPIRFSIA